MDLAHLDDGEFLSDTIIDFYMKCAPPTIYRPECMSPAMIACASREPASADTQEHCLPVRKHEPCKPVFCSLGADGVLCACMCCGMQSQPASFHHKINFAQQPVPVPPAGALWTCAATSSASTSSTASSGRS